MSTLKKVVSGGQTGADRAGLDAALWAGLEIGGWCPKGRRAEDGVVPARYPMQETVSGDYIYRTIMNITDSDATIVLCRGVPTGGSKLTVSTCHDLGKPVLVMDPSNSIILNQDCLVSFLNTLDVKILNVAGSRESKRPGIYNDALALLREVFTSEKLK